VKKLNEIPVHVEITKQSSSMLQPILHEMVVMLKTLISSGQCNIIDLTHEPLDTKDIADLNTLLGQGEINTDFNALGTTSNIRETSVSGIWWITHFNQEGDKFSEYVEITTCPELLKTVPEDLQSALSLLQDKVSQHTNQPDSTEIAERLQKMGFHPDKMATNNFN